MAQVTGTSCSMKLKLAFQDEEYNDKTKSKSYSNVKPGASNDDIFQVAYAIAGLMDDMKYTFVCVVKVVNTELSA